MTDDDILRRAGEAYPADDDTQALRQRKRARRSEAALGDGLDRCERG